MTKNNTKIKNETAKKPSFVISENAFKGIYSNFALIKHTTREFIIDFVFKLDDQAELISRVIMSPEQMKDFQKALDKNIKIFEAK